eukprot:CAMPEP_0117489020 /NCGR_PEP_ID=MMETSP0784-20121206/16818_1 /TAXON_ID=39447 /ORGANISM="" /LENGTH=585 /DNA_ID=CAMNT_0005283731 /DNA_START=97 /DNA_END=1854 /DNA_ORIENTATION=+
MTAQRPAQPPPRRKLAVSLEEVRKNSSNALLTSARYHSDEDGRRLDDDYELSHQVLGSGSSGDVQLVTSHVDGRRYALKTFDTSIMTEDQLVMLKHEAEIYLAVDHPNIARLHDIYEWEDGLAIVMECCEGGELFTRLAEKEAYSELDAAKATAQMLRAVAYLHSHSIVHRDLKLENFLYESSHVDAPLKLIDFGFAKICNQDKPLTRLCGSLLYVSPEILALTFGKQGLHGYSMKTDLWSLGVVVFMLLTGTPPFKGCDRDMARNILRGSVPWSLLTGVSADAVDFVRCLLVSDPDDRIDATAALAHPWMTQVASASAWHPPDLDWQILQSLWSYASSSRVQRAIMQLLAQELAPDESRELRDLFLHLDTAKAGTVRLCDLKDAIMGRLFGREDSWPLLDSIPSPWFVFSSQSTPENPSCESPSTPSSPPSWSPSGELGVILSTPMATPVDPELRRTTSGDLDHLLSVLDANGDEQIYYSNFLAATMEARGHLRRDAVRKAFNRLDTNGSGGISADNVRRAIGETFEGVDAAELLREAKVTFDCRGEICFEEFVLLLEMRDAVPTSARRPADFVKQSLLEAAAH